MDATNPCSSFALSKTLSHITSSFSMSRQRSLVGTPNAAPVQASKHGNVMRVVIPKPAKARSTWRLAGFDRTQRAHHLWGPGVRLASLYTRRRQPWRMDFGLDHLPNTNPSSTTQWLWGSMLICRRMFGGEHNRRVDLALEVVILTPGNVCKHTIHHYYQTLQVYPCMMLLSQTPTDPPFPDQFQMPVPPRHAFGSAVQDGTYVDGVGKIFVAFSERVMDPSGTCFFWQC